MQCDVGSCVGGRAIQSFHSGSERSCYRHGCRACPVIQPISIPSYTSNHSLRNLPSLQRAASPPKSFSCVSRAHSLPPASNLGGSYLARVDSLAGEGIVVSTHVGDGCVIMCRWLSMFLSRSSKADVLITNCKLVGSCTPSKLSEIS